MEELKARCLDVLEILSRKRLLRMMEGEEMDSSSTESETDGRNDVTTNDSCTNKENTLKVSRESVIEKNVVGLCCCKFL